MVGTRLLAAAALAGLVLLGGCNKVKRGDYDAAVGENTELRQRLGEAQASLTEVNEQNRQLTAANQQLMEENQRLAGGGAGGSGVGYTGGGSGEVVISIAGDVLFRSGQVTISDEGRRALDRVASQLNSQYAGRTIRVEGYTDSDPIRKSNWKSNEHLSAERALAVEKYLVSKGVSNDRIYSAAFGPSKPKSTKAASRRVEIVILAN
ncbi:MAG: OmpA family protein [Phycisphaerales bacterium]|nr:OmpA family protein [Phycisphaerales bacterium]